MPTIKQCKAHPTAKGCGWKKIRKDTWVRIGHRPEDVGSGVITIGKVPHPKGDLYLFVESAKLYKPTTFKTRAKALKFAKDYMGKHPRG